MNSKIFGCTRLVYNHYLDKKKTFMKREKLLYLWYYERLKSLYIDYFFKRRVY
ncbi:MAG TPA: helix-turn-helix domain-containing protein [Candidatus Faecimonas gallistercoris]|nr:helix-turn-helix domain-containing protein [Candidatus Faecimonas gallistercoris]